MVKEEYDLTKEAIRMEFDRIYAKAMASLAQDNFTAAKNLLNLAAGKLSELLSKTEGEERAALQTWILDIGGQIEKLNIRIENEKFKPQIAQRLEQEEKADTSKRKPFLVDTPDITFEDVAGMYEVKEVVRDKVIYPRLYPHLFKTFRKKSGGGILLYGLPGTGKTMVAKAIAKETGAKMFTVKPSDLLSKWFGNSEKNVRKLFLAARSERNAVIFFDEIEGFAGSRDSDSDSMNRVVGELLTQMQGVTSDGDGDGVLLIAATNRPWDIDSAFLRPGRFDERIYVPLPDLEARKVIVRNAILGVPGHEEVDVDGMAFETEGFNGADVAYLCEKAKEIAIRRVIAGNMKNKKLIKEDFDKALKEVRSSVAKKDIARLENWEKENVQDAI
jgi:transitional endoplasmic reticulum ATPase